MRRILQLDIVLFALGFVVGAALASPGYGWALLGLTAAGVSRGVFARSPAVAPLGVFAATICVAAHGPIEPRFDGPPVDVEIEGELVDGPRTFGESAAYEMRVERVDDAAVDFSVRLYVPAAAPARAGERVETFARCSAYAPVELPYDQGARARWAARGIVARCSAREAVAIHRTTSTIRRALTTRRLHIEDRLQQILGRRAGVPIAMLTGTRGLVTESERRAHQRAGTAHLLAISGVHFGALAAIAWFFALQLTRRLPFVTRRFGARRASAGAVLLTMLGYLLFVGAPISAVRAFVAVASLVVALLIGRRASGFAAVSLAATALLAVSPALIRDLGFQLSFAATAAIVLFWQRMPRWLEHDPYAFESPTRTRRLLEAIARFVLMSWAATAATAPILTATLGEFSLVAFLTNLFAVPLVSLLIFPALLSGVALADIAPPVGEWVVWWATEAMLRLTIVVEDLAALHGAVITPGVTSGGWAIFVVGCVFLVLADRLRWRSLLATAMAVAVATMIAYRKTPPMWRLHFIPVGQGDATLVESPDGRRVLIDAGGSMFGRDPGLAIVVPYLRRVGVTALDAVVVTHADTDHAGGIPAVIDSVRVEQLIAEPEQLEPIPELELTRWTDEGSRNDRSIVATIRAYGAVVLLPGDVEAAAEAEWIPHRVHVLKVAHHGSRTSSTPSFVDAARPLIAVVSAGRHNRFGHPHPSVEERLQQRGTALWSTADHGLVVVEIAPDGAIRSRVRRLE